MQQASGSGAGLLCLLTTDNFMHRSIRSAAVVHVCMGSVDTHTHLLSQQCALCLNLCACCLDLLPCIIKLPREGRQATAPVLQLTPVLIKL